MLGPLDRRLLLRFLWETSKKETLGVDCYIHTMYISSRSSSKGHMCLAEQDLAKTCNEESIL